jgi:hypothetical protein
LTLPNGVTPDKVDEFWRERLNFGGQSEEERRNVVVPGLTEFTEPHKTIVKLRLLSEEGKRRAEEEAAAEEASGRGKVVWGMPEYLSKEEESRLKEEQATVVD